MVATDLLVVPKFRMSGAIPLFPPICLNGVDIGFTMYLFVNEYIRFVRKSLDFDPALVSEDHMWTVKFEMNAFIKSCRFKDLCVLQIETSQALVVISGCGLYF